MLISANSEGANTGNKAPTKANSHPQDKLAQDDSKTTNYNNLEEF